MKAIIPVNLKSGIFSKKLQAMILTEEELILKPISTEELKESAAELMRSQKESGAGFFTRLANANKHILIACNKYKAMDVKELLDNGAEIISVDAIRGATVKQYSLVYNNAEGGNDIPPSMTIEHNWGKFTVYFLGEKSLLEHKEILNRFFNGKINW